MAGLSDYAAQAAVNWATGAKAFPAYGPRFLALLTTAFTSDAGTGGTEVSGGAYARVQFAGSVVAAGTISTGSATITMPNVSGYPWITAQSNGAGMIVWDLTSGLAVGTISSWTGTTLTLTGNASNNGSGSTDTLYISAFPAASASVGSEPGVTTPAQSATNSAVSFVQSTASWGTVVATAVYDAVTGGNLIWWDWLGNYKWSPFTCTLASPGVITCNDQTFTNGQFAMVTSKFGGVLPTGTWLATPMTVAGVSGQTFNLGVNTSAAGDGMVRQVIEQSVPINNIVTMSSGQLILSGA